MLACHWLKLIGGEKESGGNWGRTGAGAGAGAGVTGAAT